MTYGIKEVYRVNIKFKNKDEYGEFLDFIYDKDNPIHTCNRGGMSGNLRHVALYDKEDAERIRGFLQENGGKFTPFLNQH